MLGIMSLVIGEKPAEQNEHALTCSDLLHHLYLRAVVINYCVNRLSMNVNINGG